jgi:hypothetical protein
MSPAEDVAGQKFLRGDEHAVLELVADDDVVDAIVLEVTRELGELGLRRHDGDVSAIAQLRHEPIEIAGDGRREEDIAMRHDVAGDRFGIANGVDLGTRAFERGDDAA